jgi:Peptidase MA superfamily
VPRMHSGAPFEFIHGSYPLHGRLPPGKSRSLGPLFMMSIVFRHAGAPSLLTRGWLLWVAACVLGIATISRSAMAAESTSNARSPAPSFAAFTPNFSIRSYPGGPKTDEFGRLCDALREEIQKKWFGQSLAKKWEPPCEIVLHGTRDSYIRAVGRGSGQTSGCSRIEQKEGRIVARRIDLLVAQHGQTPALAHELTHIVLEDRFEGRRPPPPWLDEGIATLADTAEKRALHLRDCDMALRNGSAYHLVDLLALDRLSSPQEFAAFYGQSLSLVTYLAERKKPAKLLEFATLARKKGYDEALRETYGIDDVERLEHLWLEYVTHRPDTRSVIVTTVATVLQ